ncbi:hypothetical protein Bca52824_025263 [Brassica carinata]|uniref:Lysosomal Pro-X carboxypeptidase n=1 Tax=Brassica carinata TaxID=52824 RepID=A0A8X7VLZ0_BRACI|nr:hypothetical protein Bca52824_025263 [Brassica carinata]
MSSIFLFVLISSTISLARSEVAPLGIFPKVPRNASNRREGHQVDDSTDSDLKMFYFDQNLDHFTFTPKSYMTFQQRYTIESKHWAGADDNAPILAFLGGESSLETSSAIGFLRDNGPRLKALLVYIEHRYYGTSMPFGSGKEALKNASSLGYLNSAQALADYAAILLHVKEKYSAEHSPIIVIGGSYGGMLAAWFRLKYPHITLGALASSAPLLYFQDTLPKHGYYYIVTKVFKETSESCYNTIRQSWEEIDRVAVKPNGLLILSKKFRICNTLNNTFELKNFLDTIYASAAQYNSNQYPVASLCEAINTGANSENDLLGQIFAGVVDYKGNRSCYPISVQPTEDSIAWKWQTCSELVLPIGHDEQDTMFQTEPFRMDIKIERCKLQYGVPPRPHWVTAYYGIQDVKLILQRFGSKIIFSNGLLDPYSVGGLSLSGHCLEEHRRSRVADASKEKRNRDNRVLDHKLQKGS